MKETEEKRQKRIEYNREYNRRNQETQRLKKKIYYQKNKAWIAKQKQEHYRKHRAELLEKFKAYYQENKMAIRAAQKRYRDSNKKKIVQQKRAHYVKKGWIIKTTIDYTLKVATYKALGGKCVRCGFSDYRALQIDHINGGGGKETAKIGLMAIRRRILNGDTKNYQLLCANCNWIKRYENKELGKCPPRLDALGFPIYDESEATCGTAK